MSPIHLPMKPKVDGCLHYLSGEKIKLKPYSGALNIDFGKGVGKRDVYLL